MIDDVLGDVHAFLDDIFAELDQHGIDVSRYELDHLCYRVSTPALYEAKKQKMLGLGTLLTETLIRGRPIATFELHQPVQYKGRMISVVELPHPKSGVSVPTGLEHVEFVIGETFEIFMARHPHLTFEVEGMNRAHNPEIAVKFQKTMVKFHLSLNDVIAQESQA